MIKRYTFLFLLWMTVISIGQNTPVKNITLITTDSLFIAGSLEVLQFKTTDNSTPILYCSNSYGTTIISPKKEAKNLIYTIPKNIKNKRGLVNWSLILNHQKIKNGAFKIIAQNKVKNIETYLGPPSIQAGGRDFGMFVGIPTDTLDNPIMDNNELILKKQFLHREDQKTLIIKNLIVFDRIFSPNKTGRFLVSSSCNQTNSKEYTLDVFPSLPTNFTIDVRRNHAYADGNQMTSLITSTIKDEFDNVVSDGTHVNFIIKNKNGTYLKASGNTINGIASSKILHPDHEEVWTIKAYIPGMAESNSKIIKYQQVIKDFEVVFTNQNRQINVGPFKSFMEQTIPDGLNVNLDIYEQSSLYKNYQATTVNGKVHFNLDPTLFKNKTLTIKITSAEISKTFKSIAIW